MSNTHIKPFCDCYSVNDVPIIPDVGMLASFDPVALDQACADLCNKMPRDPHSYRGTEQGELFASTHPGTVWEMQLSHGEKIGLGTREYELIEI